MTFWTGRIIIVVYKRIVLLVKKVFWTFVVGRTAASYGRDLTVNRKSSVTRNTILGNNVNFNGIHISGGGEVIIGDNFHSGMDCLIITSNHNYDGGNKIPYDETYIEKPVRIGENVWLGDRVIVLGGVTIGEGVIIQAGSVVVNNIPPLAIAGGHPAIVFGQRDASHYFELKERGEFF